MATNRVKFEDIKKLKGSTNKKQLDKLTDSEILERALSDRDSPVPTREELKEFKKVGRKDKPRTKS